MCVCVCVKVSSALERVRNRHAYVAKIYTTPKLFPPCHAHQLRSVATVVVRFERKACRPCKDGGWHRAQTNFLSNGARGQFPRSFQSGWQTGGEGYISKDDIAICNAQGRQLIGDNVRPNNLIFSYYGHTGMARNHKFVEMWEGETSKKEYLITVEECGTLQAWAVAKRARDMEGNYEWLASVDRMEFPSVQ